MRQKFILFLLIPLILFSIESPELKAMQNDSVNLMAEEIKENIAAAISANNLAFQAEKRFELGRIFFKNEEFGAAYGEFLQFIDVVKQMNDEEKLINANLEVGRVYKQKQVFDVALDFFFKALAISEKRFDKVTGDIYSAIGGSYYDHGDFDNARKYYLKSLEAYEANGARKEIAASYNNIGEISRFKQEYEKALEYYFLAVGINKEFENNHFLATNYNNIGNVYLKQERFKEAFKFINLSRKLIEEENNAERLASVFTSIGNYYFMTGDYKKSAENYLKTIGYNSQGSEINNILIRDACLGLSMAYREMGNFRMAYRYFEKYTRLNDFIFNIDEQRKIFEAQIRHEVKQKEQEFRYLQEITERELEKKRDQKIKLTFIVILLVLMLIFLVYSYTLKTRTLKQRTLLFEQQEKLNKLEIEKKEYENQGLAAENKAFEAREQLSRLQKEKLDGEIELKNRELSTATLHVINKNEMLTSIKNSLLRTIHEYEGKQNHELNSIVGEIVNNINLDKDWESFKMHFEKVHQGFFKRMNSLFPDLTSDELKMCAYLRINLSSKEIASILNITAIAINKRRNRLRKKLILGPKDDLFVFMTKV